MRRHITHDYPDGEFWQLFTSYQHSAWRWESQPAYALGGEQENIDAFLAGTPQDPATSAYLWPWMEQVGALVAAGKSISRIRVVDEPPTDYQRWARWLDRWNTDAGEEILYLTRTQAALLGEPPFGTNDWWLIDGDQVAVMRYSTTGAFLDVELTDIHGDVSAARLFRERAIALARELDYQRRTGLLPPDPG